MIEIYKTAIVFFMSFDSTYNNAFFLKAGAHFVIDTVNELPAVIEDINRRLALGLRP